MGAAHHRGSSEQSVQTPPDFISAVKQLLGITKFSIDLAADEKNTQAAKWYDEAMNSLEQDWEESCRTGWAWLNPPYDNITPWVKKASESKDAKLVMLVPASVGSNWFRDYVYKKAGIVLLNGRIKFIGHKYVYPKDLMLLLYSPDFDGTDLTELKVWNWAKNELY